MAADGDERHAIPGIQVIADGQVVLAASTCSLALTMGAITTYTFPEGWDQLTPFMAAENRLAVAWRSAPTDAPTSGAHTHSTASHDGAKFGVLVYAEEG